MNPPIVRDRVVIIGGGVAGLATALRLAPMPVTVLVQAPLGTEASSPWAQGGIAAAMATDDSPELHAADTVAAGAGLTELPVATRIAQAAPGCIEYLVALATPFDRNAAGALLLGLEAAHTRRRIVHAGGDGTGRAVMDALICAVRATPSIEVQEGLRAVELVLEQGAVVGVKALGPSGQPFFLQARAVVLATGGVGGLYADTTNPLGATGSGLSLAARAGAVLQDIEFVQFHPTAIVLGADPMPLASEALRGEGAVLVNEKGERFMEGIAGAELAPRDVVARAVWQQVARGGAAFLDTRDALGADIARRFPSVTALCQHNGLDPAVQPIPVRPAAHYHMGGVAVDGRGRSSVTGLWACGEVASTGLHGANRLASNSLLEALACAQWVAEDIAGQGVAPVARPVALNTQSPLGEAERERDATRLAAIRKLMTSAVGVVRDAATLGEAIVQLSAESAVLARGRATDAATLGMMIAVAAHGRHESRGAHCRRDYPSPLADTGAHTRIALAEARSRAAGIAQAGGGSRRR